MPGLSHFSQRFLRCGTKGATGIEVGYVGDVPFIFFRIEDIDMVILHSYPRIRRMTEDVMAATYAQLEKTKSSHKATHVGK